MTEDSAIMPSYAYPATTEGLRRAAWQELAKAGLEPVVETGNPRIWRIDGDLNGQRVRGTAAVRTSRDRWFRLTPTANGWQPLDRVDYMLVSAFSKRYVAASATIYLFDAASVGACFDSAREARRAAGHRVDSGPFWGALDPQPADSVYHTGSGIAHGGAHFTVATVELASDADCQT
jgi:hypothetical protein